MTKKKYGRLLTRKDLEQRGICFCPTHLKQLIDAEKFPKPILLGERKRFWEEEMINNWITKRAERR